MTPNIVGIIQARLGSSRLPGKTLMPLWESKTTLELMIERLKPSTTLTRIVVATTTLEEDDPIEATCSRIGAHCFRGSSADVLSRYYAAALKFNADHIVRLTGDCPLQDYEVVDRLVSQYLNSNIDYAANALQPTYPNGFDAEIFSMTALRTAFENATLPSDREHVTPYLYGHPDLFQIANFPYHRNVSHIRLTLDEPADLEIIRQVINGRFKHGEYVHLEEILVYIEAHSELLAINQSVKRNQRYEEAIKPPSSKRP